MSKIKSSCCETETRCLSIQSENINGESGKVKERTLKIPDITVKNLEVFECKS